MKKAIPTFFKISLLVFCHLFGINPKLLAQVTSDGTVDTQVNQNGNSAEIMGGETRGSNLFHSFQDFSVPTGNEAFFDNANDISNIFSRVTGGNISNIDGAIRANGSANLFFINPAGIIFGENARLDIGGSFYGSTASSVLFEDGEFSAADLDDPPILTVNAPIGLGFRDNPADITIRGDGNGVRTTDSEIIDTQDALRVGGDATIGFIGGNLNFESATVKTAGERIELGSVNGGRVDLVEVANGFSFDYSGVEAFRDISLSGTSSVIDASGNGGGDINITGKNISINDSSGIEANTLGDEAGGEINVFATDAIEISGIENENNFISAISNQVFAGATADGGNINIETGSLSLGDRSAITTVSSGQGNAGNININANDSVSLESQGNTTQIVSSIAADAVGNGGNITINVQNSIQLAGQDNQVAITSNNSNENSDLNAGNITLNTASFNAGNGILFASHSGQGNAGSISIDTTGDVNLLNNSVLITSGTDGNSGNIEINANSLTASNSSLAISTNSLGTGAGGNISIDTIENISFSNSSNIGVSGTPGGRIDITAKNLFLTSGSAFFAGTAVDSEPFNAISGDIVINLSEDLILDTENNNETFTTIENSNRGQGNAGNITVNTRNISLLNGAEINSFTLSNGNIGDIVLNASGDINIDGFNELSNESEVIQFIGPEALGNTGLIRVSAQNLTLTNSGAIQSSVAGRADSGNIDINIADTITIDGSRELTFNDITTARGSSISSEVGLGGVGDSGDININTQNLLISREGNIGTNIFGQGNGGDININADEITLTEVGEIGSEVLGDTFTDTSPEANAGNVEINTLQLSLTDDGQISTNSLGQGNAGSIFINADEFIQVEGDNSFIRAGTLLGSAGNGGNLTIETGQLFAIDGAQISTSTLGQGNAGNLTINASESIELSGGNENGSSGLFTSALNEDGNGGNLQISTGYLIIRDDATINVSNFPSVEELQEPGTGEAGSLTVKANYLSIDNGGRINAATQAGGGGNITLDIAENIILRDTGFISARALKDANGGNINIDTDFIIAFPQGNNDIIATAERGNGGNININVESLFGIEERSLNNFSNDINASSEFSLDGTVNITNPNINPAQGAVELPSNVVELGENTQQACEANRESAAQNGLNITGKGGILPEPGSPLNSLNVTVNGETDNTSVIPEPIKTSQGKVQPARGLKLTESGDIILTAHRTSNSGDRLPETKRNCG